MCDLLRRCLIICFCITNVVIGQSKQMPDLNKYLHKHDFGVVEEGEIIKHTFEFENIGKSTINILKQVVSCGSCFKIVELPKKIKSGDTASIKLEFNTKGKHGLVEQKAVITTDSLCDKEIVLILSGIVKSVHANLSSIEFGHIKFGQNPQKELAFIASGYPNAKILNVKQKYDSVKISIDNIEEEKSHRKGKVYKIARIKIEWRGNIKKIGKFSDILHFYTNTEKYPVIDVPINAYITGNFIMKPSQVFFGRVDKTEKEIKRTCKLVWDGKSKMPDTKSMKLICEHDFIRCMATRNTKSQNEVILTLTLTNTNNIGSGIIKGVVSGQIGKELIFSVPYFAYIVKKTELEDVPVVVGGWLTTPFVHNL